MSRKQNPIITTIGDVIVRQQNFYRISLSADEMIKLATVALSTGLTISKIIALQGRECQKCGHSNISLVVPRNLLSSKKQSTGNSQFYKTVNNLPEDDI